MAELEKLIEEYEAIEDEAMMYFGRCGEKTRTKIEELTDRMNKIEQKIKALGESTHNGI